MSIIECLHGVLPDGRPVRHFLMENSSGVRVGVTEYACALTEISVPDRNGNLADIALGYDDFEGYINDSSQFNTVVGRYAGRISGARFNLNGKTYKLEENEGRNHLHGGDESGFHKRLWTGKSECTAGSYSVILKYTSPDGEGGYPGTLEAETVYCLDDNNNLEISFTAVSDMDTVVNLMHHSYFNLKGEAQGSICGHSLMISSNSILENDSDLLMTGRILPIEGTSHDFRTPVAIGENIKNPTPQSYPSQGYVSNFILDDEKKAEVWEPESGRLLKLTTDDPCLCFYSSEHLGEIAGKKGVIYPPRGAFCLEPTEYPDAPNHPGFPSAILKTGEKFNRKSVYNFSVR